MPNLALQTCHLNEMTWNHLRCDALQGNTHQASLTERSRRITIDIGRGDKTPSPRQIQSDSLSSLTPHCDHNCSLSPLAMKDNAQFHSVTFAEIERCNFHEFHILELWAFLQQPSNYSQHKLRRKLDPHKLVRIFLLICDEYFIG